MTRERWARLEPFVDAALDLAPEPRRAYLDQVASGDAAFGAELEYVVNECDHGDPLLNSAAVERFFRLFDDSPARPDTNILAQLQASLGTAYVLEREIGGGGMSRVFIAHETGLGRKVVIKVLAPELAAGLSAERFEREIKLAASLQQANIVPLLSAGSAAGFPYYTMPLVEGRSLRDRLTRDGSLPVGDAVSVLRDVVRALAYAHEHGIVHRDIKPANVLLSGGTAVVTDFGIAKALGAARGALGHDAITQTGTGIGTPAYMPPEQATGDPNVDHRADIYSFGCLAYEVFAGTPPFHGIPVHRIVAAHFRETPRPVSERRPDAPPAIAALIARCLEKDPDRRPQSAAELLEVLDTPVERTNEHLRTRARPTVLIGAAGAMMLVAGAGYLTLRGHTAESNVNAYPIAFAALPFRNLTGDTALDYRADGISDEILTAMGKVKGIQITGRGAASQYKGRSGIDERTVERALGARLLLTGTFREAAGKLTVFAQLYDSTVHGEIWSDTFDRDPKDLGPVSEEVARAITDTLRARLGGGFANGPHVSTAGATNAAALDAYLVGQDLMKRRHIPQSVPYFERAIALDSNFARAYAALARALEFYPFFVGTPPSEVRDRVVAAAKHALELDSTLADAHIALASVLSLAGRWGDMRTEFQRAAALEPDNFEAHFTYGRIATVTGNLPVSRAQLEQATKVERVSSLVSAWAAYDFFLDGQLDSASNTIALALQLDPTLLPTTNFAAEIYLATGRADAARRLMATPPPVTVMSNAPYVLARLGDTGAALRMVGDMETHRPRPWFTDIARASVMLAVGDTARALDAMERSAASSGATWAMYVSLLDPMYDPVRANPRFAALLRRAGLDPRVLTSPRGGRPR